MPARALAPAFLLATLSLPVVAWADAMPKMSKAEVLELFQVARFPLQGKVTTNHCGKQANPAISFVHLNGDGVAEAVFLDAGTCYPTGHWISILRRVASGAWTPLLEAEGVVQPIGHRTGGWYDLRYTTRGASYTLRYNGDAYAIVAQDVAIRRALAADFVLERNSEHRDLGYRVARAELNDEGHRDLLGQYDDSAWCGSVGCSGEIVMATVGGYATTGIGLPNYHGDIHILLTKHGGMHDLRFDDAHYIFRWNGREYR